MELIKESDVFVNNPGHRYLTKAQVSEMLGLSTRAIEGWMRRGHLPYLKIGRWVRFVDEDIYRHLQKYRIARHNNFIPTQRSKKLEQAAWNILADADVAVT